MVTYLPIYRPPLTVGEEEGVSRIPSPLTISHTSHCEKGVHKLSFFNTVLVSPTQYYFILTFKIRVILFFPYVPVYEAAYSIYAFQVAGMWGLHSQRMESKAICFINLPSLIECFQFLTLRRNIAPLAVFYRYFHEYCSELVNRMLLPFHGFDA